MKKLLLLSIVLFIISCSTSESARRQSASGDPEDIFFEKDMPINKKDAASDESSSPKRRDKMARSIDEELDESSSQAKDTPDKKPDMSGKFDEVGYSSWYGKQFQGKPTASGEAFDRFKLTAAHRTLPLGSVIKVQNLENNKEAVVTINDRGPFVDGRIIDVSEKAAEMLSFKDSGVAKVGISVIKKGDGIKNEEDAEDLEESNALGDEDEEEVESAKPTRLKSKKQVGKSGHSGSNPRGYTVQVGVFKEQGRASKFKESLASDYGQKVFIFPKKGSFIVQVGDFGTKEKAEVLKKQLKENGITCFIPKK
ncbi:MAG: septal ring lytic transglycosylase RlpA family protein [Leptospira sp.]|nr:septal ring lytic transglycosylase RlpA family protein [Leptospira sp.]